MSSLYVCTQVFNRHDLLRKLARSLAVSTRRPDGFCIVDHGYDKEKVKAALTGIAGIHELIITLEDPGCAHSANWQLKNLPDDRVGCGDDIQFYPDALQIMVDTPGDFIITDTSDVNPAACCLIRDNCVQRIGYFDEKISPNYLYFDDTDYIRRLELAGLRQTVAKGARVIHEKGGGQTLAMLTPAQLEEHHMRFRIASTNYSRKWGGPPFEETLTVPREL